MDPQLCSVEKQAILCGSYVRLNVPEISVIWHPFTIFTSANNQASARIIFRATGPFTSELSKRLSHIKEQYNKNYPKVLLDGMYGSSNQFQQGLSHETVVIVAGGVGIVSFISLFSLLQDKLRKSNETIDGDFDGIGNCHLITTKRLIVHWICRDKGLIDHVADNYLQIVDIPGSGTEANVEVFVHDTSKEDELGTIMTVEDNSDRPEYSDTTKLPVNIEKWNDDDEIIAAAGKSLQWQHTSFVHNAVSCINVLLISWGGLWMIQYFYENVQSRHIVYTRSSIALAIIALAIMSSIVEVVIVRIISSCHKWNYSGLNTGLNHDKYDDCSLELSHGSIGSHQDNMKQTHDSTAALSMTTTDLESGSTQQEPNIKLCKGRPNMDEILAEVLNTGGIGDVGIFLCGPRSLHQSVRDAVDGKSRFSSCSSCPAAATQKATLYEEVFEL
jgi:NAD(P)H-flavin reductase